MRYLFLLLIVALSGCSDNSTGLDEFEPYTVGSWLIKSETQAEWVGTQTAQKPASSHTTQGDTLTYSEPNGQTVILEQASDLGSELFRIRLSILDSAIVFPEDNSVPEISILFKNFRERPFVVDKEQINDGFSWTTTATWNCNDSFHDVNTIQIELFEDIDQNGNHIGHIQSIHLLIPGFHNAAEAIGC